MIYIIIFIRRGMISQIVFVYVMYFFWKAGRRVP